MPRALITDAEEKAAVAATRALSRAGYRVTAVAGRRPAAAQWSRACDERFMAPPPLHHPERFADRLAKLVRGGRYDVLIPTTEAALLAVSDHRADLEPYTRIGLPPPDVVRRALDKPTLLQVAREVGLSPPATVTCHDVGEALPAARELGYPVVVKPTRSVTADVSSHGAGARSQLGVTVAGDAAALKTALVAYAAPYNLQRYEPASALTSFAGVYAGGRFLAIAVSKYRRTWPPQAGSASLSETILPPRGLIGLAEALLVGMCWEGIFELELLGAQGRFAAIDLNPRLYGSLTLAVHAGANLPAIWSDWLRGEERPPVVAAPGVRYRWDEAEVCNALLHLRRRQWSQAAAVLRPRRNTVHAFFELTDPGPLAARLLGLTRSGSAGR